MKYLSVIIFILLSVFVNLSFADTNEDNYVRINDMLHRKLFLRSDMNADIRADSIAIPRENRMELYRMNSYPVKNTVLAIGFNFLVPYGLGSFLIGDTTDGFIQLAYGLVYTAAMVYMLDYTDLVVVNQLPLYIVGSGGALIGLGYAFLAPLVYADRWDNALKRALNIDDPAHETASGNSFNLNLVWIRF